MKTDNYYLVRVRDDNELDVEQFTKEELEKFFAEEDLVKYYGVERISFADRFPKNSDWDFEKLILIKGSIIVPNKIEVVKKWGLDK